MANTTKKLLRSLGRVGTAHQGSTREGLGRFGRGKKVRSAARQK